MKSGILVALLAFGLSASTGSSLPLPANASDSGVPYKGNSFLPAEATSGYRLLGCFYEEARLKACENLSGGLSPYWDAQVEQTEVPTGTLYTFRFVAKQAMRDAGVAVAFDQFRWTSDNYVMIPASVYNGNRQRIVNREYATGLDVWCPFTFGSAGQQCRYACDYLFRPGDADGNNPADGSGYCARWPRI